MKILYKKQNPLDLKTNLLIVPVFADEKIENNNLLANINKRLNNSLFSFVKSQKFEGNFLSSIEMPTLGHLKADIIAVYGLGKISDLTIDSLWTFYSGITTKYKNKFNEISILLTPHTDDLSHSLSIAPQAAVYGMYSFNKYKKENKDDVKLSNVTFIGSQELTISGKQLFNRGLSLGNGINFARDLVNTPTEEMSTLEISKEAKNLEKISKGKVKVTIHDEKSINKINMPLFMAVGRASKNPPRFIVLEHKPKNIKKGAKPIVFIGKGLMYDTGGLSLKPTDSMLYMKADMGGAGAVMGLFNFLANFNSDKYVIGLIAACENSVNSNSYRPGDVFKSRNGLTVEIANTDAEGRLTLADVLDYASKELNPEKIIDLATLTGACVVALGETTVATYSNNDNFANEILEAAKNAGEDFWRMPLTKKLDKQNKSDIADLKNSGGRWGGSITAALFLQNFVDKNIPWAHLDIAGPAHMGADVDHLHKGATGVCVATLAEILEN